MLSPVSDLTSIIVCSPDDAKFDAVAARYATLFDAVPHELIRIDDARSLAEGYNRGVTQSTGTRLVFAHDDVDVVSPDLASRLRWYLDRWDIVGVAGTTRLVSAAWVLAGPPYIFGQVSHPDPGGYSVSIYGAPQRYVEGIEAMDGLFLAARREVVEQLPFDEELFDGFFLYDVDFTFSAFRAGRRLVVANDIAVIHASVGNFGGDWERYARVFLVKHADRLHAQSKRLYTIGGVLVKSREEILEITSPGYWIEEPPR